MYWLYWLSLNGVTSDLTPYLFNRIPLYGVLSGYSLACLLWAYSGLTLSGLLSGLPYAVSSGLSSPRVPLLPPFPLVYRRYRYAIRLTRNGDYFV